MERNYKSLTAVKHLRLRERAIVDLSTRVEKIPTSGPRVGLRLSFTRFSRKNITQFLQLDFVPLCAKNPINATGSSV